MITLHRCGFPGCTAELKPHVLMCRAHWKRVPYSLRSKVYAAWEAWRCGEITLDALRDVQARAIDAAAEVVPATAKGGAA